MSVYEVVVSRLTVREYKTDKIPHEVVLKILEAGRVSPSSQNSQPWHFIVVSDVEIIGKLGQIATQGPFIAQAPLVIAIVMDESGRPDLDAGRALQQMELVAWEAGLGTCFVGFRLEEQMEDIKDLLNIPSGMQLITVLPFGYRLDKDLGSKRAKNRKALSEIAHNGQLGVPYEA